MVGTWGNRIGHYHDSIKDVLTKDSFERVLQNYNVLQSHNNIAINGGSSCGLSFAWEEDFNNRGNTIIDKAINATKNTDILVVIGYSFPFFNREIDRKIITSMPNLKKIYFQAPPSDVDNLKENFLAIRNDIKDLVAITDVKQFSLPSEF